MISANINTLSLPSQTPLNIIAMPISYRPITEFGLGTSLQCQKLIDLMRQLISRMTVADDSQRWPNLVEKLGEVIDTYCHENGLYAPFVTSVGEYGYAKQSLAFNLSDWTIRIDAPYLTLLPGSEIVSRVVEELRKIELVTIVIAQNPHLQKRDTQETNFSMEDKQEGIRDLHAIGISIGNLSILKNIVKKSASSASQIHSVWPEINKIREKFSSSNQNNNFDTLLEVLGENLIDFKRNTVDSYLSAIKDITLANFMALIKQLKLNINEIIQTGVFRNAMVMSLEKETSITVYCEPSPHYEQAIFYIEIARLLKPPSLEIILAHMSGPLAQAQVQLVIEEQFNGTIKLWLSNCKHIPLTLLNKDDQIMHAQAWLKSASNLKKQSGKYKKMFEKLMLVTGIDMNSHKFM